MNRAFGVLGLLFCGIISIGLISSGSVAHADVRLPDFIMTPDVRPLSQTFLGGSIEIGLSAKQAVNLTQITLTSSGIAFVLGYAGNFSNPAIKLLQKIKLPWIGEKISSIKVPVNPFDINSNIHHEISWSTLVGELSRLIGELANPNSNMKTIVKKIIFDSLKDEPRNRDFLNTIPQLAREPLLSLAFNRDWIADQAATATINGLQNNTGKILEVIAQSVGSLFRF